jgi:hypothetical protein
MTRICPKFWSLNMPTHDPDLTHKNDDSSPGYETTDANVKDTALFLIVLGASLVVVFVLAFGIGKLINMELAREDGPTNKWSQLAGAKPANLVSDPQLQQQELQQMVKKFPTPRLETDDGDLDVAQMHAREDILLNHYSWANEQSQIVRIPITRAMQLLAQRGLPVEAPQSEAAGPRGAKRQQGSNGEQGTGEQAMFGDGSNAVTAPLTDGFARTAPELRMMEAKEQQMENGTVHNTRAELHVGH